MVRRQRSKDAIYPQVRKKRSKGALEVEGDREVVRRDFCRANQVQSQSTTGSKLGITPELPGVVHVARIVGLPIRPDQVWSQMERPGGGIGAHTPILHGGHLGRCLSVDDAQGIAIKEG